MEETIFWRPSHSDVALLTSLPLPFFAAAKPTPHLLERILLFLPVYILTGLLFF